METPEFKNLISIIQLQAETITAYKTINHLVDRVNNLESSIKKLLENEKPNTNNETPSSVQSTSTSNSK